MKALQTKLESIWNEDVIVHEASDKEMAKEQLQDIMDQLRGLSQDAAGLMQEFFPNAYRQGDAYGAFEFGSSSNPHDTSFEKLLSELDDEDEEDSEY